MGGSHSSGADGSGKEMAANHEHNTTNEPDIYPLTIKKEPEDLTRRNIRHVHHHPDSRIICSSGNSNNNDSSKGESAGSAGSVISRVMADGELVHEMIPRLESITHVMANSDGRSGEGGPPPPSSSVIHIRRPPQQQHDNESSMLPPAALDLARAAIQQQYSPSAYNNNNNLAGIQQQNNQHGYDSSPGPAYNMVSPNEPGGAYSSAGIHPSSGGRNQQQPGGYSSTDTFYRDYFNSGAAAGSTSGSNGEQYARAVAQMAYSTSGDVHETTGFVDRFIRTQQQQAVYKQQQPGTGLTVDLPSPDSGIGVDAVTPRDQSVAQQVVHHSIVKFTQHLLILYRLDGV